MRVLHVITGLATGGAERALVNLLSGGMATAFESVVVSLRDEGTHGAAIRDLGVSVHALGMRRGIPSWRTVRDLRRMVVDSQPDVIQGWMYHGNLAAILASWFAPRCPAVAWNVRHSLYDLQAEKMLTRQIIRGNRALSAWPHAIVYNAKIPRNQHETFGFASARGHVIPNGFDLARLGPDLVRGNAVRQTLGIAADARVLGHVARLHPMKNHLGFLRAAVRVAERHDDVHILLSGTGVTADNVKLRVQIPERLRPRFHLLGERSDVPDLMRAMDVLCLSSAWGEAFPNVLGEAMAAAVPCVATDVGDCAEIIGNTGTVVQPRDDDALSQGLLAVLGKPPEERRTLGEAARARIQASYSLQAVVAEYADLYRKLNKNRTEKEQV